MKLSEKSKEKEKPPVVPENIEDVVSEMERLIPVLYELLKQAQEKNLRIRVLSGRIREAEMREDSFFCRAGLGEQVKRRYHFEGFFLLQTMLESLENVLTGKPPIDLLVNCPPWGWRL
jgi:hypothetical protein